MPWYAFLLYPFAMLYNLVTKTRNVLFDLGWNKSVKSSIPAIVVGNLSVGGTGKTPMVEYLIRYLATRYKVGTLSRGYGRETKGFLKATDNSSPQQIGDEPFQIFQKYGAQAKVFVGEDRVNAIRQISSDHPALEVMILDDAFQHRYIQGALTILLTTYQQPFYCDFLLPMGRLRESRVGAKRADLVIMTKCPVALSDSEKIKIQEKVQAYTKKGVTTIFSSISYGAPYPIIETASMSTNVLLLTGLANDAPLVNFVSAHYNLLYTLSYADHYDYQEDDFTKILKVFNSFESHSPVLLTTEKDAVKVKSTAPKGFLKEIPIFVLPIEARFSLEDAQVLEQLINDKVLSKGNI